MEEILEIEKFSLKRQIGNIFVLLPNHIELDSVVRVQSYFSLPDGGPKTYLQGKTLPTQRVDMHKFGLLELANFIAEHYMWCSKQYLTLWRSLEDDSVEIKSDEHMLD
uniref:Uncharacterized protein n=1 Tax=Leersia perrieri TaxID=77586 RepID=A0A0D9XYR2_9ORYZ